MRALIAVWLGWCAAMLAIGVGFSAQAQPSAPPGGQCSSGASSESGEIVTRFGEWFSPNVTLDAQTRTAAKIVRPPENTVAVRLQIAAQTPAGQRWSLILREPNLHIILAILTEKDFADTGAAGQWTGRLESPEIAAELVGGGPGVRVQFLAGMALPKNSNGVNIFSARGDTPNWADPFTERTETLYRVATEAVGMLVTGAQQVDAQGITRKATWCCTGAMLTSDIYITNWHCGGTRSLPDEAYWNAQVCANTVLDLGWQSGPPARRQFSCQAVLHQDKRLDFALLRVRPIVGPGAATGRAPPVRVSADLPASNQIFLIHHAECKPKLVSFKQCEIADRTHRAWTDPANAASGPDITHSCDTEPGASGAPVFDTSGRMIALHHLGFEKVGPQCTSDRLNKATTMASIYAALERDQPALYREIMGQ